VITKIAIADDDSESLDLLGTVLGGSTTKIHNAASGGELVALLAEHGPFDLVVIDFDMPWMDGIAAIKLARRSGIQSPVLVISGLSRPELLVSRKASLEFLHEFAAIHSLNERA
jgi:CheY-like chemotaxis protein